MLAPSQAHAPTIPVGRLPLFHVVGFTGHRQLADEAGASVAIRQALESLQSEIPGEWIALSSIADGSDQLFVQQARAIGLSWHAILPLPRAEFSRDFSPTEWPAIEETLATADHLRVISENSDREDSYFDCGIETVNGADVLLTVWDGDPARGKGGTAEVVQYAKSTGKPVLIVDAANPICPPAALAQMNRTTRSDSSTSQPRPLSIWKIVPARQDVRLHRLAATWPPH